MSDAERIVTAFGDKLASLIDRMVEIPPLSWLDRALRGPVGPDR